MKKFYVMFYDGKEKVCGTWERADNEEQACLFAEIKLICKYPNVRYTSSILFIQCCGNRKRIIKSFSY